jgi:4-diphosphocytidyl-2-C-methyl-D-erythritol kinase
MQSELDAKAGTIRLEAPAKVNLSLEVCGKRADGFHELSMANVQVGITDTVVIRRTERGIVCRADRDDLPVDDRNLAVRAAHALLGPDPTPGVAIELQKRIPSGAGLAGGSADAAAVLHGCNRLFELGHEPAALAAIGAGVGSDVPYLCYSGAAVCTGRGEVVQPVDAPAGLHLCVLWPEAELSTAAVFGACTPALTPFKERASVLFARLNEGPGWTGVGELLFNRLESAARALCPEVAGLLDTVQRIDTQGFVMTGSGSAVVALAESPGHAEEIGQQVRSVLPCQAFPTFLVFA